MNLSFISKEYIQAIVKNKDNKQIEFTLNSIYYNNYRKGLDILDDLLFNMVSESKNDDFQYFFSFDVAKKIYKDSFGGFIHEAFSNKNNDFIKWIMKSEFLGYKFNYNRVIYLSVQHQNIQLLTFMYDYITDRNLELLNDAFKLAYTYQNTENEDILESLWSNKQLNDIIFNNYIETYNKIKLTMSIKEF